LRYLHQSHTVEKSQLKDYLEFGAVGSKKLMPWKIYSGYRSFMEKIQDVKGLGGMLNGFRELVKDEKKITFVGSPGFLRPSPFSWVIRCEIKIWPLYQA
jgi:hypothetical protein